MLLLAIIFYSPLFAQEQEEEIIDQDVQEEQLNENEVNAADEAAVEVPEEGKQPKQPAQRQQDKIQVECVCPEPIPQEEVAVEEQVAPAIFPENAVFNITPASEPRPVEEQQEESKLPPGYLEKLPPGYSNDQYKRIESY